MGCTGTRLRTSAMKPRIEDHNLDRRGFLSVTADCGRRLGTSDDDGRRGGRPDVLGHHEYFTTERFLRRPMKGIEMPMVQKAIMIRVREKRPYLTALPT